MAKKKSKMYQEVYIKKICHAKMHANKVGMMHDESKGQRIGKVPSLHLFHTTVTVRQCMAQSQDSEKAQCNLEVAEILRLRKT